MKISLEDINWLAVTSATVAYCMFSGIWHRPFAFGKKWEQAMGFTRPQNWKETSIYYVIPLAGCFIAAIALHILINIANINSLNEALLLGLIAGVGFATTTTFTNAVIPIMKKPLVFGLITGVAHAIGITIASVLIYLIDGQA
jgi:Protein of unknown function (DUF1761)